VSTQHPPAYRQGVEDVCEELRQEPGIEAVTLGRQVQERRTVSQVWRPRALTSVTALIMLLITDAGDVPRFVAL